ncbi:FAD-dependent oxidoreductase [Nocardioides sp.]|uniref:FAD-dependent oxidoreductase n=1 Tax=Nocardioides sp. TaxID=35761 RepID=UPI0025E5B147|nr:FAD-dependent oxidoreductase [Nocardioides sp.]
MSSTHSVAPVQASTIGTWHDEADVVVVGFGVAGASAALEAAGVGADVLVLERAGAAGGAAALSDGMVYLGGGTATQVAAGVEDTPEAMAAFLRLACGPGADDAKIDVYVERSVEHHDWLVAQGAEFVGTLDSEHVGPSAARGQGLMFTGGENAAPFAALVPPAPRAHITQGSRPGGARLMEVLVEAATSAGARASYDTRALCLVVDDGVVVGVLVRRFGETRAVRARRGVVLAAGGFAFSDDMLARHAPAGLRTPHRLGTDGDDGTAISMATAMGARTKHLDALEWALPFNLARGNLSGILVDQTGRRFVNEDTYMGRVGQAAMHRERVLLILDEEALDPQRFPLPITWAAETVEELEADAGLPAGSLTTTLHHYNEHAAAGCDPIYGKAAAWLRPLTGPLAAFDLGPHAFPNSIFTLGGLDTLPSGEVLAADGSPVPGLYAAGRTTSGVAAHGYCSGLSLGDGSLFGRISGLSAAGRT